MPTKLLLILSIIFCATLSSCSKKDIELQETNITLHYGDKYQINAKSKTPILYTSSNNYHAEVDQTGLVSAHFVGNTTICLQNDYEEKSINVIIEPQHHLYVEPHIAFGESKNSIINKYGNPTSSNEKTIAYKNYGLIGFSLLVMFDDNDNVNGYAVIVPTLYNSILSDFLGERYMFIGTQDYTLIFVNGLTIKTATMVIGAKLYNTDYWAVLYAPISESKNITPNTDMLNQLNSILK